MPSRERRAIADTPWCAQVYELGASIIYSKNYHVVGLADTLGLELVKKPSGDNAFQIYDGSTFVFNQVERCCGFDWSVFLATQKVVTLGSFT